VSGLDQSDELTADKVGTVIAARAGYDPLGLVFVLTTLDFIDVEEPRGSLMFMIRPPLPLVSASLLWSISPMKPLPNILDRFAIRSDLRVSKSACFRPTRIGRTAKVNI